jgi:hypothetical protein
MKKIVFVLITPLAVLFLAQLGLNVFLAGYLESSLIPGTAKRFGIQQAAIDIPRLGLFRTVIGPLRLGDGDRDFLDIASIKINYTPAGLINRHIDRVILDGVTVNAAWRDNSLTLPGFSPPPATEKTTGKPPVLPWPVTIGALEINNAMINLFLADDLFQVPVTLNLVSLDKGMKVVDTTLSLSPRGQALTVRARLDTGHGNIHLQATAPAVNLNSLSDWISRLSGLDVNGRAGLSAEADIRLSPLRVSSAAVNLSLSKGNLAYQDIALGPVDNRNPLSIHVSGSTDGGWQVNGSPMAVFATVPFRLSGFKGSVSAPSEYGNRQGAFSITLDRSAESTTPDFCLLAPVAVAGAIDMVSLKNAWRVDITGKQAADRSAACRIKAGDVTVDTPVPAFTFSAEGTGSQTGIKARIVLSGADINTGTEKITVSDGVIQAGADISHTRDKRASVSGHLQLSTGKIADSVQQAEIKKVSVDFPFQWPQPGRDRGELGIGPLTWQGLDLGSLTGRLQQRGKGVEISGLYTLGLVPGLKGDLSGTLSMDDDAPAMRMKLHLHHPGDAGEIDLGRFLPRAAGMVVKADLDAVVDVGLADGRLTGRLTSQIDNGHVLSAEKDLAITGITAGLTIPDLPAFKSAPDQKIVFKKASLGDIQLTDGEFEFQLESGRTIFLEKSSFKWCRGSVYAEGMRISPDRAEYDLTLYSDRLNLAEVLNQIGSIHAGGDGTVSGRIPIRYAGGDISINNGFLFSAPGEGGIIYLNKTDILTAGLPKNSPQYGQIDLAREALKNYRYDWAKVLLNSEGKDLHVTLSFDGRPTRSLPFIYDKKKGGFVRDKEARQLSEFKGLSLDVNFRIPLNELIGYKKLLEM